MLISIHIPKTAGFAFREHLDSIFKNEIFHYYDMEYEFTEPRKPILLTQLYRKWKLIKLNLKGFGHITPMHKCIHGHFRASTFLMSFPDAKLVTWLRDPVERVASHYYYWLREPDYGSDVCKYLHKRKLTLEQFSELDYVRNFQFRYLNGVPLEKFWFVGIQEEYKRDIKRFYTLLGQEMTEKNIKDNKNPNKPVDKKYDIQPEIRNKIINLNDLDYNIYNQALGLCK